MERQLAQLRGSMSATEIEASVRAARGFGRELDGSGRDAAIVELCTELGLRRDRLVSEAREELGGALQSDGVVHADCSQLPLILVVDA